MRYISLKPHCISPDCKPRQAHLHDALIAKLTSYPSLLLDIISSRMLTSDENMETEFEDPADVDIIQTVKPGNEMETFIFSATLSKDL